MVSSRRESYSGNWDDKRIYREEKVESEIVIVGSSLQALGYILQIIGSNETEDKVEKENQNMCLEKSEMLDKMGIELLALGIYQM